MSDYNALRHGASDYFTNTQDTPGISPMIDLWRMTSSWYTDNAVVTSNWIHDGDLGGGQAITSNFNRQRYMIDGHAYHYHYHLLMVLA